MNTFQLGSKSRQSLEGVHPDLAGDMGDEVAAYVARRKAAGKKAFLDGPHFELPASVYP